MCARTPAFPAARHEDRGKLGHSAGEGEREREGGEKLFNGEPRRAETHRSSFSTTDRDYRNTQKHRHHGSHLDSVWNEAEKWQREMQSARDAQRRQLRVLFIRGKSNFYFPLCMC